MEKSRPFDAYDGGVKVFGAIAEVLEHGGPPERALQAGKNALLDLRRPASTALDISTSWKIGGPDDNGHAWLYVDFDQAQSSINLGKLEEVREKMIEWLGEAEE